jgi:hypothetical protein
MMRDGVPFYFLPDMDLGPRDSVFVPFFGVPAATVTSVARLAQMTEAVVVPCVTEMTAQGYVARLYPAWENYPGGDLVAATARNEPVHRGTGRRNAGPVPLDPQALQDPAAGGARVSMAGPLPTRACWRNKGHLNEAAVHQDAVCRQ